MLLKILDDGTWNYEFELFEESNIARTQDLFRDIGDKKRKSQIAWEHEQRKLGKGNEIDEFYRLAKKGEWTYPCGDKNCPMSEVIDICDEMPMVVFWLENEYGKPQVPGIYRDDKEMTEKIQKENDENSRIRELYYQRYADKIKRQYSDNQEYKDLVKEYFNK